MKKFIAGVIVGGFLFAGAFAFADGSSLIGQKVQGLFSVEKAGTKVADAIVINGTAYAPVRAVSDATETELTVEGKRIIIQEKEVQPTVSNASVSDQIKATRILEITKSIEASQSEITKVQSDLAAEKAKLERAQTDGEKETVSFSIQMLESKLEILNNLLTQAETKLVELQK
ncbi:hypothetical protein MHB77_29470 [Paenibacillus sp. FSL K6-3166]|uniref:hypothetical protein n=1 Tax=unclassified Paenibacillus TaxID=185978 RepID=UPI000B9FFA1C|nr:hypothetical protein [Paenibacillus sp. VTT E-133291]OZQ95856.1 hypothetical protein CA598_08485 [Paenibacillus sp. VTT E-133291]